MGTHVNKPGVLHRKKHATLSLPPWLVEWQRLLMAFLPSWRVRVSCWYNVKSSTYFYWSCVFCFHYNLFTDSFDFQYEYQKDALIVDNEFFEEKFSLGKVLWFPCFFSFVVIFLASLFGVIAVTKVSKDRQIVGLSCVSSKVTDARLKSIHSTVRYFRLLLGHRDQFCLVMNPTCRCVKLRKIPSCLWCGSTRLCQTIWKSFRWQSTITPSPRGHTNLE